MTTINILTHDSGTPEIDFTWDTVGDNQYAVSFTTVGAIYTPGSESSHSTYFYTEVDDIEFTASTNFHNDEYAIEYQWDFGDGQIDYGAVISHTYAIYAPVQHVTLKITTNKNHIYYTTRQVYFIRPIVISAPYINIDVGFGSITIVPDLLVTTSSININAQFGELVTDLGASGSSGASGA